MATLGASLLSDGCYHLPPESREIERESIVIESSKDGFDPILAIEHETMVMPDSRDNETAMREAE